MTIQIKFMDKDYGMQNLIGFFKEVDGRLYILNSDVWSEIPEGSNQSVTGVEHTLLINHRDLPEVLQQLSDLCAKKGYYPSGYKAAKQEIERVENHLDDARITRDRLLTMLEVINGQGQSRKETEARN